MRLVKLDAIGSTNDFLKEMSHSETLENFTVVTAETQTAGKGQHGSTWTSQSGKNLIMSVFVKDFIFFTSDIFHLNIVFALAVTDALLEINVPDLRIKWPNDILSGNKKIGGVLIENSIKGENNVSSVIGLGLNVNQTDFAELPKASSLFLIMERKFDKEAILLSIIQNLQNRISLWRSEGALQKNEYTKKLFKVGLPMPFQNTDRKRFMAIIQGVSEQGKLQLLMEDDTVSEFNIKEIEMLY